MPLEIIVAMTQGQIGYMIESSLDRALMEMGVTTEQLFVSLISYVVVDEKDPAFQNPTKPIGPFYTEEQARGLPYTMVKTDKGFRRVVASPTPLAIVEHREIKKLIEMEFIVICCGGGGIPVIRKERKFRGVDAVIDKDLASAVLAGEIKADVFVIASDVPGVSVHWGSPTSACSETPRPNGAPLRKAPRRPGPRCRPRSVSRATGGGRHLPRGGDRTRPGGGRPKSCDRHLARGDGRRGRATLYQQGRP
jgi:carbamate kinase